MRFGVEEEFFVVDADSRRVVPEAAAVVVEAMKELGGQVDGEDTALQVETRTIPCGETRDLAEQIRTNRFRVASSAARRGLAVVATGTPVLGEAVPAPVHKDARSELGRATVRGLLDDYVFCALQVHVEMPDREFAVLMSNHLRPYLPTLIALTANSPYWCGRDSGYASWRTILWSRWPVAGPPPLLRSAAHYAELVAMMREAEALLDERTVYWDIRPSPRYPTLEVRAADVPVTAEESASFAALVRALAVSLRPVVEKGDPGPAVEPELMRLAYWRAARDGMSGRGVDVRTGELLPTAELARRLVADARPGLEEHGDVDLVVRWLRRLIDVGDGAARQRAVAAERGSLSAVVDYLVQQTRGGGFR